MRGSVTLRGSAAETAAGAEASNYPFCTIEPNVGIVPVPDPRLALINKYIACKTILPSALNTQYSILNTALCALLRIKSPGGSPVRGQG